MKGANRALRTAMKTKRRLSLRTSALWSFQPCANAWIPDVAHPSTKSFLFFSLTNSFLT